MEEAISFERRKTLIKSTLSSIPIYLMSLFVIPRKISFRLEKIQRDFLWRGGSLLKKPYLVKWVVICLGKKDVALVLAIFPLQRPCLVSEVGNLQ